MLCRNPYVAKVGEAYGCGQCLPCRINRKREWTHRIILEASQYQHNCFATLTYSDEQLAEHCPNGTLVPKHAQDWLKRIRFRIQPSKLRFFLVGEYGDETERPHYHAALFNFPTCRRGRSVFSRHSNRCCDSCDLVRETWGMGNIILGTLEPHSAAYISGYVTKKMTAKDDERLDGRYPEFARMSLRPGIGADAMHEVASQILTHYPDIDDVPTSLRHGKSIKPLGRYLTRYLRMLTGREKNAPQSVLDKKRQELQALSEIAAVISPSPRHRRETFKYLVREENAQKALNMEGKQKLFKQRKAL